MVNNPMLMRNLASDNLIAESRQEAGVAGEVVGYTWWKGSPRLLVWGTDGRGKEGVDEVVVKHPCIFHFCRVRALDI